MKLNLKISLLSFYFLYTTNASAIPCMEPFEGISGNFILQEKLQCKNAIQQMDLRITNANDTKFEEIGDDSFYMQAGCADNRKYMNLQYNVSEGLIVNFSEDIQNTEGLFKIDLACKKGTIAILDTHRKQISINGQNTYVTFSVYENDASQSLMAYVLESEDSESSLLLRSSNGTIIGRAIKKLISQTQELCYANWVVKTDTNPTILSYILSWKDNIALSCAPKPKPDSGAIVASVFVSSFVVGSSVAAILVYYYRQKLGFLKNHYESIND